MDNRRLLLAISISLAILVLFQVAANMFLPKPPAAKHHAAQTTTQTTAPSSKTATNGAPSAPSASTSAPSAAPGGPGAPSAKAAAKAAPAAPRVAIEAPDLQGSISLRGAMLDEIRLTQYHETVKKTSPLVQLLAPPGSAKPYFVQFGWDAAPGQTVAVPGPDTIWKSSGGKITPGHDVTLSWTNKAGVTFEILLGIDDRYMISVHQKVINKSGQPIKVFPWSRIRRDWLPQENGTYILFKGAIGALNDSLHEVGYGDLRSQAKHHNGTALEKTTKGGWFGITGKYWLTALIPDQNATVHAAFRHIPGDAAKAKDTGYQVDEMPASPLTVAAGGTAQTGMHVFAGAKVLHILNSYEQKYHIPLFEHAIDFGWFYFLTKPIFLALDWLNTAFGNFGVSIIIFTAMLKIVLFPAVWTSYRSMAKMRAIAPKIQEMRKQLKDDQAAQQKAMMALYKEEGVNPAAGCLPMLLQIPIFFSLYKVIFITIEMRHAPFILWIHDLSAEAPTNIFNLFGLIPFDPTTISPFLHVGVLPILMGLTMWGQQRLNPPPPDPTQAKLFQFMPVIFTFVLARFPTGLVLYYTVNNLLTMAQQWFIMRTTKQEKRHHAPAKANAGTKRGAGGGSKPSQRPSKP